MLLLDKSVCFEVERFVSFFQETVFAMLVETTGNIPYFMYMYACPLTV